LKTRSELSRSLFVGIGAELGVAAGVFSETILQNRNVELLYSIDRWTDHHNLKEYFNASKKLHKAANSNSIILRMTFSEACEMFPDNSLDFVYIDGYAHTGQENGGTLEEWLLKIKSCGIISGHDYDPRWPLTVEAVDRFVDKHKLILNTTNGNDEFQSWWCVKP